MSSFNWRPLIALSAREVFVIGCFLAIPDFTNDWSIVVALATCGVFVVGLVALLSCRRGGVGGAIAGLLCGLLPSHLVVGWALAARPGFMAGAGAFGVATILAPLSGAGGALAGIICSGRTKVSMTSRLHNS
jgi:hypothetical protein